MSAAIGAFLGGWAVLSVLVQMPILYWVRRRVGARDYCSVIPVWSFFVHFGGYYLDLWYQDTRASGDVTCWNSVMLHNAFARRVQWNARKGYWKMLERACYALLDGEAGEAAGRGWEKSLAYQLTLTAVLVRAQESARRHRQCMIARVLFGQEADQVFMSLKHVCVEKEIIEDMDLESDHIFLVARTGGKATRGR